MDASAPSTSKDIVSTVQARQLQQTIQQGLGRPIVSSIVDGQRVVVVGNTRHASMRWKTFHDFLFYYIEVALGKEWWRAESKKDPGAQHPILRWYALAQEYQRSRTNPAQTVQLAPMTGAVAAYLGLAYNLYLLAHNATLQARLIGRLREPKQFNGAYYETHVAGALIKAGFTLALENEDDLSRTHCEFTASHEATGRSFSVEAKARDPGKTKTGVGNQLHKALTKEAAHPRVVFIEMSLPDDEEGEGYERWLQEARDSIRAKETTLRIAGEPPPAAYVFLTNRPYHYTLESSGFRELVVAEGFKIADFGHAKAFSSITEARLARERHREMHELLRSMQTHYAIPITFDGEIPEFAFGTSIPRLLIGHRYVIPDANGVNIPGTLTQVTVNETAQQALGAYELEDGRQIIATCPLTPEELSAWKRHPDTMFGAYQQQSRTIDDPLELFDWFYSVYRQTPKEQLLRFMAVDVETHALASKDQGELAILYCEGLVQATLASRTPSRPR